MNPVLEFDLQQLSELAQVTPRTIRYYIQQGLLPAPDPQGPATRYGREHLDRLQLIRQLQREHQPLAEIRRQLEGLAAEDIRRLASAKPTNKRPSSAVDYVRSVLGGSPARSPVTAPDPLARTTPSTQGRSQWERLPLTPDVELHVRRPLTRDANRRVEKLLDLARQLFQEEE